jgi:hypothetical protein
MTQDQQRSAETTRRSRLQMLVAGVVTLLLLAGLYLAPAISIARCKIDGC